MKKIQKRIDEINALVDKQTGGMTHTQYMLKIGEEYGELCEAVLAEEGKQRQIKLDTHDSRNVEKELADVIVTALVLARRMNFDLDTLINEKLNFVERRFNKE